MRFRDFWMPNGRVGRWTYFSVGFAAMAIKYNLDRLIAASLHRDWSPLSYWFPSLGVSLADLGGPERQFAGLMLTVSLPFIALGASMTLQRLRDAGWPLWLLPTFFVPFVNVLFFLALAATPSKDAADGGAKRAWSRYLPESRRGAAASAVALTSLFALPVAVLGVRVLGGYGWGLFVGIPFTQGLAAAYLYGLRGPRSAPDSILVAVVSVMMLGALIFTLAIEGILCLAMAAPLGCILGALGGLAGWAVRANEGPGPRAAAALPVLLACLPVLMGAERIAQTGTPLTAVETVVDVDAPPEAVWDALIAFTDIGPPTEWWFRAGIAYPTHARIEGTGVGAVRHCVFSTGAFVEPITLWDEPRRLEFDVVEQPPPMIEWSWYDHVNAPHIDGFFRSERGRFVLEPTAAGTRLIGTTWYRHDLWPQAYWRPWSDAIVHAIHRRVLEHIRRGVEAAQSLSVEPGLSFEVWEGSTASTTSAL